MSSASATFRRDAWVISLVGTAHGLSHFYQLVLPPLFPYLKEAFGVSYTALGLVMSVYFAVSGLCQTAAGFVVDRIGARAVLFAGIGVAALAALAVAASPGYWALLLVAVFAGLGNSVFHPADFSLLNALVQPRRLGHAFSVHGIGGSLGWAIAAPAVTALAALLGWRGAALSCGALGLVALGVLWGRRELLDDSAARRAAAEAEGSAPHRRSAFLALLSVPVLLGFAFFTLLSMSLSGMQSFGIPSFAQLYGVPVVVSAAGLTGYLLGSAMGTAAGGFAAGASRRHDFVAAGGLCVAAALMATIGSGVLSPAMLVPAATAAGFAVGMTGPSRDLLIRAATPRGATGRVYGFVYSGLDAGAAVAPPLLGALLDHGRPDLVFLAIAGLLLVAIATVMQLGGRKA